MKTAVDFLVKEFSDILGKLKTEPMQDLLLVDAIQRAKEMEKEQIEQAFGNGIVSGITNQKGNGKQYYKETFKPE